MPDISPLAVAVATLAAFLLSDAYYALLGNQLATISPASGSNHTPAPTTLAVELARCLLITLVVAGLASRAAVNTAAGGLLLGLALWIGFPLVLWIGGIVHERTPVKLAAIHASDWLLKLPPSLHWSRCCSSPAPQAARFVACPNEKLRRRAPTDRQESTPRKDQDTERIRTPCQLPRPSPGAGTALPVADRSRDTIGRRAG